jgi:hypothetical protein
MENTMAKTENAKPNRAASQKIKDERQLIFRTPGNITTKYSVYIETDSQRHAFHVAGVRSPAEALWLSLGEYFSNSHSQTAITEILVIGYYQTKKEREQGIAHASVHFPPLPTSK